jgi:hypothetical protein
MISSTFEPYRREILQSESPFFTIWYIPLGEGVQVMTGFSSIIRGEAQAVKRIIINKDANLTIGMGPRYKDRYSKNLLREDYKYNTPN